jgi:hypothetical protein
LKKIWVREKTAQEIKEGHPLAATGTLLFFGCPNEITLLGDPQPLSSIGMERWKPLGCESRKCFHVKDNCSQTPIIGLTGTD